MRRGLAGGVGGLWLCLGVGVAGAAPAPCAMDGATPWISVWLDAWDLTAREILKLPDAPPPHLVFFDSACVYTTAPLPGVAGGPGPRVGGHAVAWSAAAHGDSIPLPTGAMLEIALMSFAQSDRATGPYFVMAAPSYWQARGIGKEPGLTGVFLHEYAHVRQIPGVAHVLGPIDSVWSEPEELDDDAVQRKFEKDSVHVQAYLAERDLFYRAAAAGTTDSSRALAREALAAMRARHGRWYTGKDSVYAALDAMFLSLEGAGQWTAAAWLAHPKGGGMTKEAAVERMLGRRRRWSQDEGLAIFLVLEKLLPGWPELVFAVPSADAIELLERAVAEPQRR